MAHRLHKMNVKQQWQRWLLRLEEVLRQLLYKLEAIKVTAVIQDGTLYQGDVQHRLGVVG
jgi:hypothetical protein